MQMNEWMNYYSSALLEIKEDRDMAFEWIEFMNSERVSMELES